jgi:hypothetical protein
MFHFINFLNNQNQYFFQNFIFYPLPIKSIELKASLELKSIADANYYLALSNNLKLSVF